MTKFVTTNAKPKHPSFDPTLAPLQVKPATNDELLQSVPNSQLSPTALRARFANPPKWNQELTGDKFRLDDRPIVKAAVLVPIVMHAGGATLLLTMRSAHLSDHAGQIAFPGGRCDDTDANVEATALREAFEEIGLHDGAIEVIGLLPVYQTGTGYAVTPVVALVQPGETLVLQVTEVDEAFEVPLEFLMDPANHQQRMIQIKDQDRLFYAMPYTIAGKEYFIWGATAAMIRQLYRLLSA